MQVAGQAAPRCSLVGGAYNHNCISFSLSVLRRLLRILSTFKSQCLRQYVERVILIHACYKIAREPPPMSLIRLLQRKPDGEIVFREPISGDVPAYAILSHTWGKEEVIFQDIQVGAT